MEDFKKEEIKHQHEYLDHAMKDRDNLMKVISGIKQISRGFSLLAESLEESQLHKCDERIKEHGDRIKELTK